MFTLAASGYNRECKKIMQVSRHTGSNGVICGARMLNLPKWMLWTAAVTPFNHYGVPNSKNMLRKTPPVKSGLGNGGPPLGYNTLTNRK
jgi:hypothetical protein